MGCLRRILFDISFGPKHFFSVKFAVKVDFVLPDALLELASIAPVSSLGHFLVSRLHPASFEFELVK